MNLKLEDKVSPISTFVSTRLTQQRRRMKFLIVLASVLGVGLCQLLAGGLHHQPANTFPKYKAVAEAELPGLQATDSIVVTDVQTQVQTEEQIKHVFDDN